MSYVNVWGCTGNLEHTQHLIEKGGVLEMFCRINLDYFEGYTVTGVTQTHGHDGHIQPREWVLGLSGMSLRYLLCTRPLEADTKIKNRAVLDRISTGSRTRVPEGAVPYNRSSGCTRLVRSVVR